MSNKQKNKLNNKPHISFLSAIFSVLSFPFLFSKYSKNNTNSNKQTLYKCLLNYIIIALQIFSSIGFLAFLANKEHIPLLIAPFGATAALLYSTPKSTMAKPVNVLLGHLISAFIGICCYQICGNNWYAISFSLSLSVIFMLLSNTMHPPGGATAVLCVISQKSFVFLLMPLGMGLAILLIISYAGNILRHFFKVKIL